MKCPKCQFENPDGSKFCLECGLNLDLKCPHCGKELPSAAKFCNTCGHKIEQPPEPPKPIPPLESERKHVTVLFSDMSGYTAMTEKLDPEEVKEIMGKIFGEITKVISKYEGFIEKFVGDAVMALFGVPKSHEDDPVRAIKAARDIHEIVSSISPQYEKRIGKPLSMHTGICTGLVVTGEVNLEKGTHGVLGDTINTAARLSGLANPGEIIITPNTYHHSEGYFNFETLEPTTVKGKTEPVKPYKVLSPREEPTKIHRLSGLRADLIGRKVEMAQLQEALNNLTQGKGSIFSIVGDAGTGKSRLIEEFKTRLDLNTIQWREGHAYSYSQNIPYFPLIDLLSRAWQIQEGDNPEQVRKKVEAGAGFLISERSDLIPYLGSLYSLKYPEIESVSPDYWKAKLHEASQMIFSALTRRAQTIICIEDLHWADPSSVELLRNILSDFRYPAIFFCIYRPAFSLFTSHQMSTIKSYQEIRLHDLSPSEAQSMVESLLKTDSAPGELKKFIQGRVEGNPFYLEEVINSLLEAAILVSEDGQWTLTKPLIEANIPSTVQGVISARLDRLETETKRILQEASVIGRAFLYEILKRITELKEQIDRSLMGLERLDLIRTRTLQPDLEYIFKHALTQEVVYNGLLKKERQNIHEKIGQVMEELFKNRLPEFYEALAYHFKQGHSVIKAVDYLMKAGEKSLNRYAVEESHQYYKEAFDLLSNKANKSKEEKELLIDLLIDWAVVHNRRASYGEITDLLKGHESLAISLNDKARLGMFYTHLGHGLGFLVRYKESYRYLHMALELGEETGNENIIGYACGWLPWTCNDLGLLDESVVMGKRVQALNIYKSEPEIFRFSTGGLAVAYYFLGEAGKAKETASVAVDYGQRYHYVPCLAQGYTWLGMGYMSAGDFASAIEYGEKAVDAALEPQFVVNAKVIKGWAYLANGQYREASRILQEVNKLAENCGYPFMAEPAKMLSAIVMITEGHIHQGIEALEGLIESNLKSGGRYRYALMNYQLGKVYLQIVRGGGGKKDFSFLAKNIGFLIKTIPFAHKKAEDHFNKAIQTAKEIGAKGVLAQAYFDMGRLRQTKGKTDEARQYISDAVQLFEECEADVFLRQAREALASLN